jgi:hypothetical protein
MTRQRTDEVHSACSTDVVIRFIQLVFSLHNRSMQTTRMRADLEQNFETSSTMHVDEAYALMHTSCIYYSATSS